MSRTYGWNRIGFVIPLESVPGTKDCNNSDNCSGNVRDAFRRLYLWPLSTTQNASAHQCCECFSSATLSECSESSGLILPQGSLLRNLSYLSLSLSEPPVSVWLSFWGQTIELLLFWFDSKQPPDDAVMFGPLMNIDLVLSVLIVPLCCFLCTSMHSQTVFVEQQVYSQRSQISNLLFSLEQHCNRLHFSLIPVRFRVMCFARTSSRN